MPAKKKPAPKAPAKAAKKAAAAPDAKTTKAKPASTSSKAPPAPVKQTASKSPPVKKESPKPAAKAAAKKAAAKPAPAKKEAAKPAAKKAAPAAAAKKEAAPAKKAAPEPPPAPKAVKAAPAPLPVKAEKEKKAAPAKAEKAAPAKKASAPSTTPKIAQVRRTGRIEDEGITMEAPPKKPVLPAAFLKTQRKRLVELRDAYLNSAEGVAAEGLRGSEGGDASAFGMHQADAGSDAYDRDFALSLLAKEQDAIYEINEALKRIDSGTYGICEMSGEIIPEERLEALPFTRFTVGCQERIEQEQRSGRWNRPVRSLFGLDESADDSDDDRDEDDSSSSNSGNNESLDFSKE